MNVFHLLIVGAGGGLGAISRYGIAWACQHWMKIAYPIGTLIANVAGCFLIGLLIGTGKAEASETTRLALGVGFLGGLTTFSSFGAETIHHLHQGEYATAGGHVLLNIVLGLIAVAVGIALGRKVAA